MSWGQCPVLPPGTTLTQEAGARPRLGAGERPAEDARCTKNVFDNSWGSPAQCLAAAPYSVPFLVFVKDIFWSFSSESHTGGPPRSAKGHLPSGGEQATGQTFNLDGSDVPV